MSDHVKLRIKFQKTGAIRYIGHLDVMRFFQKCLRRAEIDVSFTGGFSPHQIMSFAAPLSVGLESYGEYVDVEVNSLTSSQDMLDRMNRASIPEIRIVGVKRLPEEAGNAMASVAAAEYLVTFKEGRTPAAFEKDGRTIREMLDAFMALPEIPYVKKSKKGSREMDLRRGIFSFQWLEESNALQMLLDASSGDNVKPAQVLEAFLERQGEILPENALQIVRLDTYTRREADGDREGALISMDEVGEVF